MKVLATVLIYSVNSEVILPMRLSLAHTSGFTSSKFSSCVWGSQAERENWKQFRLELPFIYEGNCLICNKWSRIYKLLSSGHI